MTESIEILRDKLYASWGKTSYTEILSISQELDVEIVRYMKQPHNSQKHFPTHKGGLVSNASCIVV